MTKDAAKGKKKKKAQKANLHSQETSPAKSLGLELENLRAGLNETLRVYREKLQADLGIVRDWNAGLMANGKSPSREQIRDIGDMIGLLRKLKLKPEKGRRRDLRRIENTIEDLLVLARHKRV